MGYILKITKSFKVFAFIGPHHVFKHVDMILTHHDVM